MINDTHIKCIIIPPGRSRHPLFCHSTSGHTFRQVLAWYVHIILYKSMAPCYYETTRCSEVGRHTSFSELIVPSFDTPSTHSIWIQKQRQIKVTIPTPIPKPNQTAFRRSNDKSTNAAQGPSAYSTSSTLSRPQSIFVPPKDHYLV